MNSDEPARASLDSLHHVAIEVDDVASAVDWYRETFRCGVAYQDSTWALLNFRNVQLALVTRGEHPPHIGFVTERAADHGTLQPHRDGTRSVYVQDSAGNTVELLDAASIA